MPEEKQTDNLYKRVVTNKKRSILPIFLLILFSIYQGGITLFTHTHYVNGVMIVHSHPSKDKHHTHSKESILVIDRLSNFYTIQAEETHFIPIKQPILWEVGNEVLLFIMPNLHLKQTSLRAPPFFG